MTETPMKLLVNCETGEHTYVPLSAEEIAENEARAADFVAAEATRVAEEEAKASQKASVLSALATAAGLSVDEVTAALGA